MNETVLRAEGLVVRRRGLTVLDLPWLEVRRGETLAIMGPNGSGKSTLLQTLALLLPPTTGRLWFDGELINSRSDLVEWRRRMAVVFQAPLLLDMSVESNVALGLRLRQTPKDEIKERVELWLDRFGILRLARRPARSLSGGEAQRVSLARAFALSPEVLFLDEPFSALDAPTHANIVSDLSHILNETGTTAVFVTHDRDEALALGDRLGVLFEGRILQLDTPEAVFAAPADVRVAGLVGTDTVLPGQVVSQAEGIACLQVGQTQVYGVTDLAAGRQAWVCLRPEDVTLLSVNGAEIGSSARNRLVGRVERINPWGTQTRVVVDCGFPVVAAVTRRSVAELGLAPGRPVVVSFKASAVHLIPR